MPKTFYTEHDIEDMFKRGVMSLEVNDNVSLTDLAYERAKRLGMNLVSPSAENPPAAPIRPYITKGQPVPAPVASAISQMPVLQAPTFPINLTPKPDAADLQKRIREVVIARLGTTVDSNLLDTIINRVLTSTGIK